MLFERALLVEYGFAACAMSKIQTDMQMVAKYFGEYIKQNASKPSFFNDVGQ